jgi:replication factor A1
MSTNIELKDTKIQELQPFANKFNLNFKVIEKTETREVSNRNNTFETHRISDITVADDTGAIIFTAWDDDIDLLEEGNCFKLENGFTNVFRDSMRLSKGKFGKLLPIDEEVTADTSNNRSDEVHERPQRQYDNNRGRDRAPRNDNYRSKGERTLRF